MFEKRRKVMKKATCKRIVRWTGRLGAIAMAICFTAGVAHAAAYIDNYPGLKADLDVCVVTSGAWDPQPRDTKQTTLPLAIIASSMKGYPTKESCRKEIQLDVSTVNLNGPLVIKRDGLLITSKEGEKDIVEFDAK